MAILALWTGTAGCVPAVPPTSDVPCVRPRAWPAEFLTPLVRAAGAGSDVLLVTSQTIDQSIADSDDGSLDFLPHRAVYRLDPQVGSFELVNDATWDNADSEVRLVTGSGPTSPLGAVDVVGGHRLSSTTSPTRAVAAVLSSDGFSPGTPFVTSGFGTGQHYHQLFSEIDGSPIGDAVRVGVGNAIVVGTWTAQEDYVVYWQRASQRGTGETMLCAVPITEDLPPLEGE